MWGETPLKFHNLTKFGKQITLIKIRFSKFLIMLQYLEKTIWQQ